MTEKTERRLKIIINSILILLVIFSVVTIGSHSKYTDTEHAIEQGKVPAHVTKPVVENGETDGEDTKGSAKKPTTKEEYMNTLDLTSYKNYTYDAILDRCVGKTDAKIWLEGTIYSVLETKSAITYNVADNDGNYYSIIDGTGYMEKFKKTSEIRIYGVPNSVGKFNGTEIPSLKADFIEKK